MDSYNCTTDHKQSGPIAGSTSFMIIILSVLFVFQSVFPALRIPEIRQVVVRTYFFVCLFFALFHTLSFFTMERRKMKNQGG